MSPEQKRQHMQPNEAQTLQEAAADEQASERTAQENGARLKGEMDDLLDEIDKVLETNAAEFVRNYVQKGGE